MPWWTTRSFTLRRYLYVRIIDCMTPRSMVASCSNVNSGRLRKSQPTRPRSFCSPGTEHRSYQPGPWSSYSRTEAAREESVADRVARKLKGAVFDVGAESRQAIWLVDHSSRPQYRPLLQLPPVV